VSLSRFYGEEPDTTTTYEYDDDGRLISSVSVRDPEWSDQDRGIAAALFDIEAARCPGCGGDLTETTVETPGRGWDVEHKKCFRCEALHGVKDTYHKGAKDKSGESDVNRLIWTVEAVSPKQPTVGGARG